MDKKITIFLKALTKNISSFSERHVYFLPWLDRQWKTDVVDIKIGNETKYSFEDGNLEITIQEKFKKKEVGQELFKSFLRRDRSRCAY